MPNLAPTPSATPITGIYCKTFPAVRFEANRFADLSWRWMNYYRE